MKKFFLPAVVAAVLMSGCVHHTPLITEHAVAIDPELLGLWEWIPPDGEGDVPQDMMLILKWSETEYLAQLPAGKKGDFYRAYPVEIGGRRVIQAQSLGSPRGEVHEGDRVVFPILSYRIEKGILAISTLNTQVVDEHIADGEALSEAFLENIDRPDLFGPPEHFRRAGNK